MSSPDAPPSQRIVRLVGVYDADATFRGELSYWVGARLGRRHCALCDITHGTVRERPEWAACRTGLPIPFDTFHRTTNRHLSATQQADRPRRGRGNRSWSPTAPLTDRARSLRRVDRTTHGSHRTCRGAFRAELDGPVRTKHHDTGSPQPDVVSSRPEVVVYTRPGCPYCVALRAGLRCSRVAYREVNIWDDPDAAAFVRSVANGNETVPTVTIGTNAMVNPTARHVRSLVTAATGETDTVRRWWWPGRRSPTR